MTRNKFLSLDSSMVERFLGKEQASVRFTVLAPISVGFEFEEKRTFVAKTSQ